MSSADLSQSLNAPLFAREKLGLEPDPIQKKILKLMARRVLLNCTRQWGKSTIAAVKAVHRAVFEPGSLTVVLGPSERQSGEFLRKAAGMVRKLGVRPRGDGDNKVSLLFPNESRIVGLPGTEKHGAWILGGVADADRRGVASCGRAIPRGHADAGDR
jgi:hypothetical protein